ncbi:hypothetical protein F5Y10DRAFT_244278, partial [Nemania abortiva]
MDEAVPSGGRVLDGPQTHGLLPDKSQRWQRPHPATTVGKNSDKLITNSDSGYTSGSSEEGSGMLSRLRRKFRSGEPQDSGERHPLPPGLGDISRSWGGGTGSAVAGGNPGPNTLPQPSTQELQLLGAGDAYRQPGQQDEMQAAILEGNVHYGGGNQIVGSHMRRGHQPRDLVQVTANLVYRNNRFERGGGGYQVIGQQVGPGATATAFSGHFYDNTNYGPNDQVIGLSF